MGSSAEIPDKSYFKIGEVARIVGVKPSVLRFWETEFRSIRPEKSPTNQRLYSRRHVERILEIKELLYEQKYTIAGARRRLREAGAGSEAEPKELLVRIQRAVEDLLRLVDE